MGCGSTQSLYCLAFEGLRRGRILRGADSPCGSFPWMAWIIFCVRSMAGCFGGCGGSGVSGPGLGSLIPAFDRHGRVVSFWRREWALSQFWDFLFPNFLKSYVLRRLTALEQSLLYYTSSIILFVAYQTCTEKQLIVKIRHWWHNSNSLFSRYSSNRL